MAQLYSDENFPLPVVEELRRLGHDVLTILEDGKANQRFPDDNLLQIASAYGRAILTINRKHFWRLHEFGVAHAGMILCTYDPDLVGQAERIHQILIAYETVVGQLIRVNRTSN